MSVVVYNKFNLDAVLAAALIKSIGDTNTKIFDNTMIAPTDHEEYLWLDLELEKAPKWAKTPFGNKKNYIICHDNSDENGFISALFKTHNIITKAENKVLPIELIMKLNGCISKFYNNTITLDELVLIFVNLKIAERILHSTDTVPTESFRDIDSEGKDLSDFKQYIKSVKQRNTNNHNHQYIKFKSRLLETFVTSVQEDWIWIKRLLMLGDQKYVNINMTPIGCIVDTNLPDFDKHRVDIGVRLSNVY
jgi:hypothetical protein